MTRLLNTAFALALALVAVAAPALAQRTGPVGPRTHDVPFNGKVSDSDRARYVMVEFARCTLGSRPGQVQKYLSMLPSDRAWGSATAALANDECLQSGELRFNPRLLRGSLYIAKYQRDFRSAEPQIRTEQVNYLPADLPKDDPQWKGVYYAVVSFSDCVVRANPASSRDLVLAPIATARESAALNALMPALSGCLPSGSKLKIGKEQLTGGIAEALYRLSIPATVPAAVAGKN